MHAVVLLCQEMPRHRLVSQPRFSSIVIYFCIRVGDATTLAMNCARRWIYPFKGSEGMGHLCILAPLVFFFLLFFARRGEEGGGREGGCVDPRLAVCVLFFCFVSIFTGCPRQGLRCANGGVEREMLARAVLHIKKCFEMSTINRTHCSSSLFDNFIFIFLC